eukprot:5675718-Amphidinium_carterae.1
MELGKSNHSDKLSFGRPFWILGYLQVLEVVVSLNANLGSDCRWWLFKGQSSSVFRPIGRSSASCLAC